MFAPALAKPAAPALLPVPLSSASPPHAEIAVADTNVALNASVAARDKRLRGSCGGGVSARSRGNAQNGHCSSETRT
jgi:hypothetical protein